MKTAVIGNSHAAALKRGWDRSVWPEPDFFACGSVRLLETKIENGAIVPTSDFVRKSIEMTSGGLDRIPVRDYDMIWLAGLEFGLAWFMRPFLTHRLYEDRVSGIPIMSRAAFEAAIRPPGEGHVLVHLLELIRQLSAKPVAILPMPMPSEAIVECPRHGYAWKKPVVRELLAKQREAGRQLSSDYDAMVMAQPPETLCGEWFTRREFSIGSARLDGVIHPDTEYFHMNERYGRIAMKEAAHELSRSVYAGRSGER